MNTNISQWRYHSVLTIPEHAFVLLNDTLNLQLRHKFDTYETSNFMLRLDDTTMHIWFESLNDENFVITTVYRISSIVCVEPNTAALEFYDCTGDETNKIQLTPSDELKEAFNAPRSYEYIRSIYVSNIYEVSHILNSEFLTNVFTRRNTGTYTSLDKKFQIKLDHNVIDIYVATCCPEFSLTLLMERISSAIKNYSI